MQSDGGEADDGHYFFFSAPASPVHYILRSPPSSTAPAAAADGHCCGGTGGTGDFEFFAARAGGMSSAEDLFVAGRIRVGGGLSPIRQEDSGREDQDSGEDDDEVDGNGRDGGRAPRTRRARSASPPRSPRAATGAEAPASSSSSASSSLAKTTRRRISLRDLLTGTGSGDSGAAEQGSDGTAGGAAGIRSGFWPPSIWPSRSKKALLPCPAPLPGRRSTSSERAVATPAKKLTPGGSARRTTSLPYRQGLVLGCLGFGARSYGLAKSMHPLYSR